MIKCVARLGLVCLLAGFVSLARADNISADADTSHIAVEPGKQYIYKESGGKPRAMEIYFPPGWSAARKVPGVVMFHGGGWVTGDLKQFRYACQYLASRGLVAATVDYQMNTLGARYTMKPPGAFVRVCITDAKSAIRWMKQHAAELGVDPNKIIVGGGSAGADLAVFTTTTPDLDDPHDPPGIDTSVVAYILFNPALDLASMKLTDPAVNVFDRLKPGFAPAIFFQGTKDRFLPGTEKMVKQLKALGDNDVELWTAQDKPHGFFNGQPWTDITLTEADRFLVQHGLLQGKGTLPPPGGGEKLDKAF